MSGRRNFISVLLALISVISLSAAPSGGIVPTDQRRLADGTFELHAHGPGGMVYSLQTSHDSNEWRTIDFTPSVSGDVTFADNPAASGASNRYYRIRQDPPKVGIQITNYHGWTNCIVMQNAQAEVDIVPAVGRIMQFRLLNQADGPFWENPRAFGSPPAHGWGHFAGSFGGDKVWPAPQSAWQWPPPSAFDSMADAGAITNGMVILTTPADPASGLRAVRRITLHPTEPILRISTTFEKVTGGPGTAGVWVVTQLKPSQNVFMPVPTSSLFTGGYLDIGDVRSDVKRQKNLVTFAWNPAAPGKIGNDADALLWMGPQCELLIESPHSLGVSKTAYPDNGCHAEIYTNPGRAAYLEMEFMGPLSQLAVSGTTEMTTVYSLFPRGSRTPIEEAHRLLEQ